MSTEAEAWEIVQSPSLLQPSAWFIGLPECPSEGLRASWMEPELSAPRLGLRFEALVEAWVRQVYRPSQVFRNLVIPRDARETLGELDLVFVPTQGSTQPQHWELSVKFYLCVAAQPFEAQEPSRYVGLMFRDRLDRKVSQLVGHQLPLGSHELGLKRLQELGVSPPRSRALVRGCLFYPWRWRVAEIRVPESVNPGHWRGVWCREAELPQYLAYRKAEGAGWLWPIPKLRWLRQAEHFGPPLECREPFEPGTMMALMREQQPGTWREGERVVVVSDAWVAAAQAGTTTSVRIHSGPSRL